MRRCAGCGSDFEPPANNKAKRFCTQRCWITYFNRTDRDHSVAGAQKGAASNQSKWASFKSNKSYKKRDGEHLHRQVAAETLGLVRQSTRDGISAGDVSRDDWTQA
jgi:hypothetical protein